MFMTYENYIACTSRGDVYDVGILKDPIRIYSEKKNFQRFPLCPVRVLDLLSVFENFFERPSGGGYALKILLKHEVNNEIPLWRVCAPF